MIEKNTPITNQTISVNAIECKMKPVNTKLYDCAFFDQIGVESTIHNVAFINIDVRGVRFETHRDKETSEAVIYAEFDDPTTCEILGENTRGLTFNCPTT